MAVDCVKYRLEHARSDGVEVMNFEEHENTGMEIKEKTNDFTRSFIYQWFYFNPRVIWVGMKYNIIIKKAFLNMAQHIDSNASSLFGLHASKQAQDKFLVFCICVPSHYSLSSSVLFK